jgi:uncharacterized protein
MFRGAAFAVIAWISLTCAVMAQAPAATSLTFPALTGRVVDEAGLLSAEDRATLAASLAGLEARTTDQLVVVTLKSLQGTTIEDYGYQLGRRWGIGQKDKDSGVLLIVAAAERRVRIEVGYGLEGTLTDAATRLIIENSILPAFKAGDFPGGIKGGASQIIQVLGGGAGALPRAAARGAAGAPPQAGTPVWLGVVLGLGGVGLLIFCAVRGGTACRGIMQLLLLLALSGRSGSSRGRSPSFSGGGGSFGGGGSSGSW